MTALFSNPSLDEICARLRGVRTVAVVGLSPKPNRPSHTVAQALQQFGYRIVPVRPAVDEVLGERAYADLRAVPAAIDLVDVFRAPEYVDEIVDTCIALKVPALWLQDGVVNEAAALRAQAAGIWVVMDRCIYRDYLACDNGLSNAGD
jgi:predicted CoA-binding protein